MDEIVQQLWLGLQETANNSSPLQDPTAADTPLNLFVFFVQWSAVVLSALAGLYAARKRGMDIYGALVIAFIVPLGGGTLRDLLLGRYPIFWIDEPVYAVTVVVIAIYKPLCRFRGKTKSNCCQSRTTCCADHG